MPNVENDAPKECGEHYAAHPSKPHLVAVCTLPRGHDGPHDNVLPKRVIPPGTGDARDAAE